MEGKNFFEHWEAAVLSGKERRTFLSALRNLHFKRETEAAFREALQAWANEHGVGLEFGFDITIDRKSKACVFFMLPPG